MRQTTLFDESQTPALAGELPQGARWMPGLLARPERLDLVQAIMAIQSEAPFFVPRMPRTGAPFSVRMTNFGPRGWVSDQKGGYRYQGFHPETLAPWPPPPPILLRIWREATGRSDAPQACLVNLYQGGARMGLHQDRDEEDVTAPVVSISLGADAIFRVGGLSRKAPRLRMILRSGDVFVLKGPMRLAFHGIDRILATGEAIIPGGGRINLTLRRVTRD